MDIQKEKEAFEAWFESRYGAHFMQFALDLDFYVDKHTQTCWEAWQAKAQAVPEWISVDDELPSEGDLLLGISTTKLAKFNVYQVVALDEFDDCEITHWMHLPQAPTEQEQRHESPNP